MGKRNSEAAAVHHSSIALLRERFRRLERVKELREEREQNKAMADAGRRSPCLSCEEQKPAISKWFIHPELSGGPSSSFRMRQEQKEIQSFETLISVQPIGYSEGDVDTSLHL